MLTCVRLDDAVVAVVAVDAEWLAAIGLSQESPNRLVASFSEVTMIALQEVDADGT